jgi:pectate lyase
MRIKYLNSGIVLLITLACGTSYAAPLLIKSAHDIAPSNGWAGVDGGTSGGSTAKADQIYQVHNQQELLAALKTGGEQNKIIQLVGIIDVADNKPYQSADDQKARSLVTVPANTTLIGVGKKAGFIHGSLLISGVRNVIVRNLTIEAPIDVAPKFEEGDGWNAEWDGMTITNSQHVWVDHITFTDGSFTDKNYAEKDGWEYVQHDGMLDIKRGSDFVTVSYSVFKQHDKTMLIGHSDKNAEQDAGKLHVTLHHNLFDRTVQRSPRVRFGRIHAYNNVYMGDKKATEYAYLYSFGIGKDGGVLSEANQFEIANLPDQCQIVKSFKGTLFKDVGSLVNGHSFTLPDTCEYDSELPSPAYQYQLEAVSKVKGDVMKHAGAGHI